MEKPLPPNTKDKSEIDPQAHQPPHQALHTSLSAQPLTRYSSQLSHSFHLWVTETTLQALELIEEMDRNNGVEIGELLKASFFAVVECMVKYLALGGSDGKHFEAVKRVWRGRISNLQKLVIWVFFNGDFGYGLLWDFDDFVGFEKMGALGFMNLYLS